ncbi:hypothetical protein NE848_12790 [Gramella jeungdoensis]|uniref:Uncharacterized protein n=1 Tax=Gramella jeungdoensis TaxID=708091 RepID=A0ABT0Z3F5_9FLAO|nr:hypothetical protein [Gramella jeungdoensis]MCM8570263.1 hypothetical protein [Gramella jeungdoensis]
MRSLYLTLDAPMETIEETSGCTFNYAEVYEPLWNVGTSGTVFIIPEDNSSHIYPAQLGLGPLRGDKFPGIIITNKIEHRGEVVKESKKPFGIKCMVVDDGGGNNYKAYPELKDNKFQFVELNGVATI